MKRKIRNSILTGILFILTVALALGAGSYRNSVSAERAQFQAKIPAEENTPIVLDLAKQSWPKKFVQPGKVQIYTGHGPTGVQNSGKEELLVQVQLIGFPSDVDLEMTGVEYDENTFAFKRPLKPNQLFKMELSVDVPKEYRNKLIGFSAEIQFLDQKDRTSLGSIPVHIVNSKYGDPYKELNVEPASFGNGNWNRNGKVGEKGNGSDKFKDNPKENDKNGSNGKDSEKDNKENEDCH